MIGDSVTDDGDEFEVVWSGGEGLIPDRDTKPSNFWAPPKRLYTKPETIKRRRAFTEDEVVDIIYNVGIGRTFAEIGRGYGVLGITISRIVKRTLDRLDKLAGTPENGVSANKFDKTEENDDTQ